jgi:hypothetical protein
MLLQMKPKNVYKYFSNSYYIYTHISIKRIESNIKRISINKKKKYIIYIYIHSFKTTI